MTHNAPLLSPEVCETLFDEAQERHLCGRLCWQGAPYATAVLYNPVWSQAVALSPAWLEQQLRSRQSKVVSGIQLFDDAATRALGQVLPK